MKLARNVFAIGTQKAKTPARILIVSILDACPVCFKARLFVRVRGGHGFKCACCGTPRMAPVTPTTPSAA